jgi:hypothetical protein
MLVMTGEGQPPQIEYHLGWEYDSHDPEFIRGAEVGELEARLQLQPDQNVLLIMRRTNEEMLKRITRSHNRSYQIEIIDEIFMNVLVFPTHVHALVEVPDQ